MKLSQANKKILIKGALIRIFSEWYRLGNVTASARLSLAFHAPTGAIAFGVPTDGNFSFTICPFL